MFLKTLAEVQIRDSAVGGVKKFKWYFFYFASLIKCPFRNTVALISLLMQQAAEKHQFNWTQKDNECFSSPSGGVLFAKLDKGLLS